MAVSRPNRKKYKRKLTISLMLVMMFLLAIVTSASISAFERLRDSFLNSHVFTLKEISIQGNHRVSSADILNAADLNVGIDNIYSIVYNIVEERIKARFRYLEQVEIKRRLIIERSKGIHGLLTITVKEREPMAFVCSGGYAGGSLLVVDESGFIIEKVEMDLDTCSASSYGDIPVIFGVDGEFVTDDVSRVVDYPTLNLALDVLINARSAIPELFDGISYIDARNPDNIILCLREQSKTKKEGSAVAVDDPLLVAIAGDRIKEGLSSVLSVIVKRRRENQETRYIDARFPGAVYCSDLTYGERGWKSG